VHVVPFSIGIEGSSCSIGSGFLPSGVGTGVDVRMRFAVGVEERKISLPPSIDDGIKIEGATVVLTGAGRTVGSVECEPEVHPGSARNSSNEVTRFLQQA
jgi:hypothetical protein